MLLVTDHAFSYCIFLWINEQIGQWWRYAVSSDACLFLYCVHIALFCSPPFWPQESANMANSAIHHSGVGKWVVIHVIRYMDYGVKT